MPYKHIAAHLKKTELACRLHYHQLSHGSNRRKRTPSYSSGSDVSPVMNTTMPSPIHESQSRAISPATSSAMAAAVANYQLVSSSSMHLPSIMTDDGSAKLPAILPKPASMDMSAVSRGATPPVYASTEPHRHSSLPPPSFHHSRPASATTPPLRLDCSALPPPSSLTHTSAHVDLNRLHHVYAARRNSFWSAIASEYGSNATPAMLEQAWKTGICCGQYPGDRGGSPITPAASPAHSERDSYIRGQDKTRISSILADTDPRSAHDRDMVRRMDEQRFSSMSASA
jgi:hypothetical protein